MYGIYYQAYIYKEQCGFLVSVLRSFEHLVFDRTLDKETSFFEFYVSPDLEEIFLELMDYFVRTEVVHSYVKKENRLQDPHALL